MNREDRELLAILCHCSAELQRAHKVAADANRADIVEELRCAAVDVADAISLCVPDRRVVEVA